MGKNFSKKKGSLSIFIVMILPLIITLSVILYHLLNNRHIENERLKLLKYSSDMQLTEYHTYLLEDYGMTAYYNGNGIKSMYGFLLKSNNHPQPSEMIVEEKLLSVPDNYMKMCLETAKVLVPVNLVNQMKNFVETKNTEIEAPALEAPSNSEPPEHSEEPKPREADQIEDLQKKLEEKKSKIDDGQVNIFHVNWDKNQTFKCQLSLAEQVAIKEYYLSIYKSLDINCPRNLDLLGRKKRKTGEIDGEIEYLIVGKASNQGNQNSVWNQIYLMREATNLLHLASCPEKRNAIATFTSLIPAPWGQIVAAATVILWSGAESYVDMQKLMEGESLSPVKVESEWHLDFDGLLKGKTGSEKPSQSHKLKWYYFDYLRLLLYIENTENVILRSMNLVNQDLKSKSSGSVHLETLSMGHHIKVKFTDDLDLTWEATYP